MPLTPEWQGRLEYWLDELKKQFFVPLGEIGWEGFFAYDHLRPEDALQRDFRPMPEGRRWGREWEYGWFRGRIVLPEQANGRRVALSIDLGGEATLYVNGRAFGTHRADWVHEKHHFLCDQLITDYGTAGEAFDILAECYAGHTYFKQGPGKAATGPLPPGRYKKPDENMERTRVGESSFGIWNEAAYQLYLDARTLAQIAERGDPDSLRTAEIEQALKDFTVIVDFEQDADGMNRSFEEARKRLSPLLECVNGSTAPLMTLFGHAHIDVAWLWPLAETERKCIRTFAAQLRHMDRYPEYVFLQSQPYLYRLTKQLDPVLYGRIREKVQQGQFIPEGGMWVEADTNITGGESLIRQFLHGKRFFRDEFGVENELLWLPDVFGYSAALPQIMKGCGIRYFSTQKIFWTYNGGERFPYHSFLWQGMDGSEVASFIHMDYNSYTDPAAVIDRWKSRVQKDGLKSFLMPFGYGDGGGGPSRDHIEYALREGNLEGVPKVRLAGPLQFFHDLEADGGPVKKYVGELYFQAHRGTFTSQARTKKGNRKSEFALREAELWGVAAHALKSLDYPLQLMDETWKLVLLHQFHDILPGSSIGRVYRESEAAYAEVLASADGVAAKAQVALLGGSEGLTVFNSLSWSRRALVELPEGYTGAMDEQGRALPVQKDGPKALAEMEIPSCGWAYLRNSGEAAAYSPGASASDRILENEHLKIVFNEYGEIESLWDQDAGCELAAGPCNSFRMYKDIPRNYDAWDIDSTYESAPVALPEKATFEVMARGPLVASVRITRKLNDSTLSQVISLRRDSRRADFETTVDWQETHKLLKVAFSVLYHAEEGIQEIQFGHIRRPNHRSRKYDEDRFEVCCHKWSALAEENRGFAVLNDCKYGVSTLGDTVSLTLLRAPTAPDMEADRGRQTFTYAFYAWNAALFECNVVREAYELNAPVTLQKGVAPSRSLFSVSAQNVLIEAVKPAEDGSGDFIVRLYECMRATADCTLSTSLPFADVWETDMLENRLNRLEAEGGSVQLKFRPFEIKTLRFANRV